MCVCLCSDARAAAAAGMLTCVLDFNDPKNAVRELLKVRQNFREKVTLPSILN